MSNINAPGVHVIEGAPVALQPNVGPTLTGFLGKAARGRVDIPQLITSWAQFVKLYGGYSPVAVDLGVYVRDFFDNSGAACRVLRVAPADAVGASEEADVLSRNGNACFGVYAASPGEWGNDLAVGFTLQEVQSTGAQQLVDNDDNDLPNNGANEDSNDTVRIPVDDITKLYAGDVVDVFTTAGVYTGSAPFVVVSVDSVGRSVILDNKGALDVTGAGFYLRTGSQHRARTFAAEAVDDTVSTSILLDSVNGISAGSILTFFLYSHCATIAARGFSATCHGIVDRIVGNRVYFTAALETTNNADIPATTNAAYRYGISATEYLTLVANDAGPVGNRVSLVVNAGLGSGSNGISVNGKTITINSLAVGGYTVTTAAAAINAHEAASALVTATATDTEDDDTILPTDLASTRFTGGAQLQVVSQEFGMKVFIGPDLAEQHDYLSTVPTNPDFVETRLGGDPATFVPVSGSQSGLIIVDGADSTVGTAAVEFAVQPRSLASVGLSGGDDGSELTDDEWIGTDSPLSGAKLLSASGDIRLAVMPGVTSVDVQRAVVAMAAEEGTYEWLLDPPVDVASDQDLLEHRNVELGLDSSFGQLASTWAYIADKRPTAIRNGEVLVPPSPAWAALVGQGQKEIGPHGSAGNKVPRTWRRLTYNAGRNVAGNLNDAGICVFRVASGTIQCLGDRTLLQVKDPRRFGPVRRMINQLIVDLEADLAGVTFLPAVESTLTRVETIIKSRLKKYHEIKCFFPQNSARQAYGVTCNLETTTPEDLSEGFIYAEVWIVPATIAEKIVLRLQVASSGISIANNL